jgi:hypothetical protein
MSFSISPSVSVREVDLTTTIPAITTAPGAIAGVFRWGPVNERVLISSEIELANVFGKPTDLNAETFFTAADFLAYSNALFVVRVVDSQAVNAKAFDTANNNVFEGKYPGAIANAFEVAYIITSNTGNTDAFSSEIDLQDVNPFSIPFNTDTLTVTTTDDFLGIDILPGDVIRLGSDTLGYQNLEITQINLDASANNGVYEHEIIFRQRYTLAQQPTRMFKEWKYAGSVSGAPLSSRLHVVVVDKVGEISGEPNQIIERFENLSVIPGLQNDDGSNIYYVDFINQRSRFLKVGTDVISQTAPSSRQYIRLADGVDSSSESLINFGSVALGYDLFKEANDVDVSFVLQGKARGGLYDSALANYIVSNISEYRKDCVAFISPSKLATVDVATEQEKLNGVLEYRNAVNNSSYWFMDTGYKYRYDKYNDTFRWVPLNGDIAGISSLVDPWESPAGFRKGVIRNVIKLAFNPNKTQRDQLYGRDVNPVITQVGQGTILFGDKTGLGTATGSAFTRINVRRLFITVQKAIANISAQFLFEINDDFTQNQFRQLVVPFLRDIQGRRGITDFRVVSDSTVNTPQVIDSNVFRANIFIQPVRSINFIELTFIATRTGVEFEEIVGQQF